MNNEEISILEQQISQIEESLPKIKDLLTDIKLCGSETSRTILTAAIRKYAQALNDFKI